MKVLILSCSTGGGHNSCGHYIEEELKDNNIECEFRDFFDIVDSKAKDLSSKISNWTSLRMYLLFAASCK